MTLDELMQRARQWDRDLAELVRDHSEHRRRLDAAVNTSTREPGRESRPGRYQ